MNETGDRSRFLTRLRTQLDRGAPPNPAHPAPAPTMTAPPVVHLRIDHDDLAATFERNATQAAATVHRVAGDDVPADLLRELVDTHDIRTAVVTDEPEARAAATTLTTLGIQVEPATRETCPTADLGVTDAAAAIAATGSVVMDSRLAGGRLASLLPPVHLCVVPPGAMVAAPADVLRHLPDDLPSNLVLVSGPSRTGDIELIITLGVHGPVALHVVLLGQ